MEPQAEDDNTCRADMSPMEHERPPQKRRSCFFCVRVVLT
jgi:hypothetical protein